MLREWDDSCENKMVIVILPPLFASLVVVRTNSASPVMMYVAERRKNSAHWLRKETPSRIQRVGDPPEDGTLGV